jgi:CheY-like chemotaxis protein
MPSDATIDTMSLKNRRILVVEDEGMQALYIAKIARELGADVIGIATSISRALAEIAEKDFDCVILDLKMEGMPSLGMAKALRAMRIPFVFCTAYGREIREPFKAPVISKPVSREALGAALLIAIQQNQ